MTKKRYDPTDPDRTHATDVLPPSVIEGGAAIFRRALARLEAQEGKNTDTRDSTSTRCVPGTAEDTTTSHP